jgi:hypothetical protein
MIELNPEDHTYHIDGIPWGYPGVTTILADMGFYGDAAKYYTEWGRDRGRFIHHIILYHVEGVLDENTIDPVLRPYFDAWLAFEKDTGFVSEHCEKSLVSTLYHFGGTPDHIGRLNSHETLIDTKSGLVNPAAKIQTAAYEILYGKRVKRFGLQLKDDGKYSLKEFKDRQDRGIFLAALAVWQWQKNNLK